MDDKWQPWQSNLGLHCLLRPVCPNTLNLYSKLLYGGFLDICAMKVLAL